jgi:ribulose-phosphate 3-epimerase
MVTRPQDILKEWFYTHADRFVVHVELEGDLDEIIKIIKEHKREVGLALNPETSVDKIEKYLDEVDFVQFMTVHPGFQGGQFVEEVVDKIEAFHKAHPDIMIMCDGAINPETASKLVEAGASALVSGSYIIKSENIEKAIGELKNSI